jgi:hypothetical protein
LLYCFATVDLLGSREIQEERRISQDIEKSINQAPYGYLERLRNNDNSSQAKFDTVIKQIYLP